jgi:NTE family protein
MAALIAARVRRLTDVLAGFGNPLLDGERLLERPWPEAMPARFKDLRLPLIIVGTDDYGRAEAVFTEGPLAPAGAASIASRV